MSIADKLSGFFDVAVNPAALRTDPQVAFGIAGDRQNAIAANSGAVVVRIDPRYFRPTEVELLIGDASKAQKELGWHAQVSFEQLVKIMVAADCALVEKQYVVAQIAAMSQSEEKQNEL